MSHKKILVIRLSAMGDVAIVVPLLLAFGLQYPNYKITVLTKPFFNPIFSNIPNVDLLNIDIDGQHKGILGLRKLAKQLQEHQFDVVADLHNVLRTKILKLFSPSTTLFKQIDKGRKEKKALVSGEIFEQLPTSLQRYAKVFDELGLSVDLKKPNYLKTPKASKSIIDLLSKHPKIIGIAPLAAFKGKTYPLVQMRRVIENLPESYSIVLFGSSNQKSELDFLVTDKNSTLNLAGAFTFEEELQLIARLNAMISMDSGNAHLAAMFGVKTLTIWGITHPFAGFYPYQQSLDYAVLVDKQKYPKIPTSIYGNKAPSDYQDAISSITPEEIVATFNKMMV